MPREAIQPDRSGVALGLQGQVALVTGGSQGIGRAIAETLADAGADIVLNYYGSLFIEAGMMYGGGNGANRVWFYARKRPSDGFMIFWPSGTPQWDNANNFTISYPGTGTTWAIGAPFGAHSIYNEPAWPRYSNAGTELTENNNRDVGDISGMQWIDTSDQPHDGWRGAGVHDYPTSNPHTTTTWVATGHIHYESSC